jgi:hypothetical protein
MNIPPTPFDKDRCLNQIPQDQTVGYCTAPDPMPWWERVRNRLFPERHVEIQWDKTGITIGRGDVVTNTFGFDVTWSSRIRTLITGRIQVNVKNVTEYRVGKAKGFCTVHALAPRWWYRKGDPRRQ